MERLPRLANQGLEVGETENAAGVTAARSGGNQPQAASIALARSLTRR
jgi:hypothetical protein